MSCKACGGTGHYAKTCGRVEPAREPVAKATKTKRDPTVPRKGHVIPWGTVAPIVRAAIAERGVIEVAPFVREHGLRSQAVESACKNGAKRGEYVHMFAAFWRRDLAAKVQALIAKAAP